MWTHEIPKSDGYYWYMFELGDEPVVICLSDVGNYDTVNLTVCGYDVPYANYMPSDHKIDGLFWPEPITPPCPQPNSSKNESAT